MITKLEVGNITGVYEVGKNGVLEIREVKSNDCGEEIKKGKERWFDIVYGNAVHRIDASILNIEDDGMFDGRANEEKAPYSELV